MWQLQGKLTNTLGAQLNAILDPLTKPRTTTLEGEDGPRPGRGGRSLHPEAAVFSAAGS